MKKNPCSIRWHQKQPAEVSGRGRPRQRDGSSVLYAAACACTGEQNEELNFDFLGGRELRDGFLDPQSCESGRRVGVPALSHQFAHHAERLVCDTEEKTPFISLFKIDI